MSVVSGVLVISLIIIGKAFSIPILSTVVNDVLYPFEKGIHLVTSTTNGFLKRFQTLNHLIKENEDLKKQINELQYENALVPQYQDQIDDLTVLLEMKKRFISYQGTGAHIIARDYGNWNKIYTIDKGISSDVKGNSVVLADGGLVGYVDEASYLTSKVISIIDSRSTVSACVVRTGDVGIVKGNIELSHDGLCRFEINGESEIMKGDQIVTSYLSDIYPPGILIGTVEQVLQSDNELVSYAYIKPVVDFEHLQQVLVVNHNASNE